MPTPRILPPLERDFLPLSVLMRDFHTAVARGKKQPLAISIVRNQGFTSTFRMNVFPDGVGKDGENCAIVERIVKSLLWIKGGYKIIIAGSKAIYEHIAACYRLGGTRDFDVELMARVYEQPFEVEYLANAADTPDTHETSSSIGRHLDGCRIGFDAGGSDRKVSAVVDGEAIYSEEVIWHPKTQTDPEYHYEGILSSMKTAASKMPRVDAIGVSAAGIYIDNRTMSASLFIAVPKDLFEKRVKNIFIDIAKEIGAPLEVANDGDVTALAGAMDLDSDSVLGVAMGTSEAGGYVDTSGNITGWLNELAFVPVNGNPGSSVDEWSGDIGCGVSYFSQDAVIRLAPIAGIELPTDYTLAEKLKYVQDLHEKDDKRTGAIYESIGVYFGYAVAYYALFYDIKHVLIMGRVTSGEGGNILLQKAREVLAVEFLDLNKTIQLNIPDEKSRRVGQSVAAASLPAV